MSKEDDNFSNKLLERTIEQRQQIADYDAALEWYGEAEVATIDDGKRARDIRAKYSQDVRKED